MSQLSNRARKFRNAGFAVAIVGGVALCSVGASGAWFTANESLPVQGSTGQLSMLVNGAPSNAAPLVFNNIVPGDANIRSASFTVKNTGTVTADVSVGVPVSIASVSGNSALLANNAAEIKSDLEVGIASYLPYQAIGQVKTPAVSLGQLTPGQTATYTVYVGLVDGAGNDWANASASGTATVSLEQSH